MEENINSIIKVIVVKLDRIFKLHYKSLIPGGVARSVVIPLEMQVVPRLIPACVCHNLSFFLFR